MKKRKVIGYGYVGEWNNGTLGWFLPMHLRANNTKRKQFETPRASFGGAIGEMGVPCKITIEEIPGNRRKATK